MPQNIEQYLLSKQVEELGAGLMVEYNRSRDDFTCLIQRLLHESSFEQHATVLSKQYDGYIPEQAVEYVVRLIKSNI